MDSHHRALSLAARCGLGGQDLLVSSRFSNNILRYDAQSGEFLRVFAAAPELTNPNGIAYGPDGNLYVGLGDGDAVVRYDGQSGVYLAPFTQPGAGGLLSVRDIEFGPDGDLYVASGATNRVLHFDGDTGEYLGVAAEGHNLNGPVRLTFGPAGELMLARR